MQWLGIQPPGLKLAGLVGEWKVEVAHGPQRPVFNVQHSSPFPSALLTDKDTLILPTNHYLLLVGPQNLTFQLEYLPR